MVKRRLSDEEFAKIVRHYERRLYVVALSMLKDTEEALDVVQDAFMRLYRSFGSIKNPSNLNSWLIQTTRNLAIDRMRARGRRKDAISSSRFIGVESEEHFELVPKHYIDLLKEKKALSRAVEVVMETVSKLPEHYREVFLLRYMGDMSVIEIADFLGTSVSTVEGRILNARRRVRQNLQKLL